MKLEKSSHEKYVKTGYGYIAVKYYACCFCNKAIEHKKEGDWYLDLDQIIISKSFLIFCNDTCLNCFILQGKP